MIQPHVVIDKRDIRPRGGLIRNQHLLLDQHQAPVYEGHLVIRSVGPGGLVERGHGQVLAGVAVVDRMKSLHHPPRTLHVGQREILLRVNVRRTTSVWNRRERYAFIVGHALHEVFVRLVHISE